MKDKETKKRIEEIANKLKEQIEKGDIPYIDIPTRSKSNIKYDEDSQVWVYGDSKSRRSAKETSGMRKLIKMAYTLEFLNKQLDEGRSSTLRELYYLSESWDLDEAKFNKQSESDRIIEDLEIISGAKREDFHMRPEESGATIVGPIEVQETTQRGQRQIHCQKDIGEGGYQIPNDADDIDFIDNTADFVMAVETGGMRDRLVENGFDEDYNCIVTHLKGQPARATRRIIKRFHDELDLPVVVFTDGDPWSYRIYASVSYGSIKSAHMSEFLATPEAEFIGIRPEDIKEYDLPTDSLADSDINALENELEDPRFDDDFWKEQIKLQLDMGKKAEQQALASQGLDFVTETYLPERLEEMGYLG
jgi:DNA topoisomerase-6 subunit A